MVKLKTNTENARKQDEQNAAEKKKIETPTIPSAEETTE